LFSIPYKVELAKISVGKRQVIIKIFKKTASSATLAQYSLSSLELFHHSKNTSMKKLLFVALATFILGASVSAQSTVDSIAAKYKMQPMPEPFSREKAFPAIGTYQLSGTENTESAVTITLDSVNKGTIWVEGLPEGRFKARLRKGPANYQILSQKTSTGKQLTEGTLIFDVADNTLYVALGAPYVTDDPALIFAGQKQGASDEVEVKVKTSTSKTKVKSKAKFYTLTKVQVEPMGTMPATDQ